jgi:hypothetical protein
MQRLHVQSIAGMLQISIAGMFAGMLQISIAYIIMVNI